MRRHLRLSRRRLPAGRARPAAGRSGTRRLLSLAVLRRRSGGGGHDQQVPRLRRAGGAPGHGRLWLLRGRAQGARPRRIERRLPRRRSLQRRRRLSRLADRLGHDVRLDRDASGLSRPMSGASWRGRRRSVPAPSTTRSSRRRKRGTRRRNERRRRAAGVGPASGRGTARRRPVLARDSRIESGLELL